MLQSDHSYEVQRFQEWYIDKDLKDKYRLFFLEVEYVHRRVDRWTVRDVGDSEVQAPPT